MELTCTTHHDTSAPYIEWRAKYTRYVLFGELLKKNIKYIEY